MLTACPDGEIGCMFADLAHAVTHLSTGQSFGVAACAATLVVLVFGWWNLGT